MVSQYCSPVASPVWTSIYTRLKRDYRSSQLTMAKQFVFSFVVFSALVFNIQGEPTTLIFFTRIASYILLCKTPGQTDPVPRRGTVRLVRNGTHSPSYTSGRVEIYLTRWGHICDDTDFSFKEANVICNQQGYTGASSYSRAVADLHV